MTWDRAETIASTLVHGSVLLAGAFAAVKLRLYNVMSHRWRSDLECRHTDLTDGRTIFTADYTICNTGERPIRLSEVRLKLVGARTQDTLLVPDEDRLFSARICKSEDPRLRGHFRIEPGERTIFTLRAALQSLEDVVFVLCAFDSPHRRTPAGFRGLYVKAGQIPSQRTVAPAATSREVR